MFTRLQFLGSIALTTSIIGAAALSTSAAPPPFIEFDEARIYVEYNATDDDAEVVVDVDADVGLEQFIVLNPHGKVVLHLASLHTRDLGIRKIALETPEPSLAEVLAAYPAGRYKFLGKSVENQVLFSSVVLSHELPAAPTITFPLDGAVNVPKNGTATWTAGPDAESFFLELEQDELGVDLKSNIAGGSTNFGFPAGWLFGNTEYQFGMASRHENGNLTVVEIHFTTAP